MTRSAPTPQRPVRTREVCVVAGSIGKAACIKDFHCVRAADASAFYKVLLVQASLRILPTRMM